MDASKFPALTITNLSLNAQDIQAIRKESKDPIKAEIDCYLSIQNVPEEISKRNKLSQYLVDPNSRRFQFVIRIIAFLLIVIKNCHKPQDRTQLNKPPRLTDTPI